MRRLGIKATSPHQAAGELSGGNQQKALPARWLAMHPRVLLLDEPSSAVRADFPETSADQYPY